MLIVFMQENDSGILTKPIQFFDKLQDYLVAAQLMVLLCKTLQCS